MRILVVTGSHAVGKTELCDTVVKELSKEGINVAMIPEMARMLIARGIEMNDRVSEFGIVSYILEYFRFTRQVCADVVISDRSVLDLFAYISVSHPKSLRHEFVQLVEEVVRKEIANGYCYVYVPIEFAMKVDDVRPHDLDYQRKIDLRIQGILHEYRAEFITVTGSVTERALAVRRYINSLIPSA